MFKKILLLILLCPTFLFAQSIKYVKETATGLGDGSSWANASNDLQLMINNSSSHDEVWVAEGIYKPNRKSGEAAITLNDRSNVFKLKAEVKIFGGFSKTGDPSSIEDRNWNLYETILSGDIGTVRLAEDNTYNVVHSTFDTGKARLDGFTISDGYVEDWVLALKGSGIYIDESSPILANLTIKNNYTSGNGAGLYIRTWENNKSNPNIYKSSPLIINCLITDNLAGTHGGGVSVFDAAATFVNCIISKNNAYRSSAGMYLVGSSHVKLINVTVTKNNAKENPGGICILQNTKLETFNTIVFGNESPSGGIANFENPHNLTTYFNNSIISGSVDPFMDMNGGNYTPHSEKSAFGKGDNASYNFTLFGNKDILGNSRLINANIDLGAIESQVVVTEIMPTNNVLYVNKHATGNGNGSSWANAITDLSEALKWAKTVDSKWTSTNVLQIWVAQGTYTPKYAAENFPYSRNEGRENTFLLVNNTQVYGGFVGTETALSQRNVAANATILSGEIGDLNVLNDNIFNVVTAFRLSDVSRLDGFTISKGNSLDLPSRTPVHPTIDKTPLLRNSGAGLATYNSNFTVANCTIVDNVALLSGGGIFARGSNAKIVNSVIARNNKEGVYLASGGLTLINSSVVKNKGTGIQITYQCTFNMDNSITSGNIGTNFNSTFTNGGIIKNSLIDTTKYNPTQKGWNLVWGTDGGANLLTTANPYKNMDNGDYSLSSTSVAKDKGNNSLYAVATYGDKDLAGNQRIIGTIDMGAYELVGTNIAAPTANAIQNFCPKSGITLNHLSVNKITGAELYWYTSSSGVNRISDQTLLENNTTYYVSQSNGTNESSRIEIKTIAYNPPNIGKPAVNHVKCFGDNTGSIIVYVSGGQLPLTYNWSTPKAFVDKALNLSAGTYTLTVTDANGCSVTETITVNQPEKLEYKLSKTNTSIFNGATGSATINSITGGTAPYSILWSNGATTPTISNLKEGNYSVEIRDANRCITTDSIYVDGPPARPSGLSATFGNLQNTINWEANTDTDIASYNLYVGTTTAPTVLHANITHPALNYIHTGLTNGTTYFYRLKAIDKEGNESIYSTEVSATPKGPQNISFPALAAKIYGDMDFDAGATVSSNLPITYTSNNTAVATIVNGKIHIVGAGVASITAAQPGDVAFTAASSISTLLTVNPKVLSVKLVDSVKKTYDGNVLASLNETNYQLNGMVHVDDDVYLNYPSTGVYADKNVANAINIYVDQLTLLGNSANNYVLDFKYVNGVIGKITPQKLTYLSAAASKIYGENNPSLTGTVLGFVSGENLSNATTGTLIFETTANQISTVGSYQILGTGVTAQNYTLEQATSNSAALTITTRPITITADAKSKIYGDIDPALAYQITSGNLVNGDIFTGVLSRQIGENTGAYSILQNTVALNSNYKLLYKEANLTILKATLKVKANNAVRCFGDHNPKFTLSYSGFKYNDTESNLTTLPTVNTIAMATTVAGSYYLIPSGAVSSNYNFEYLQGILTINELPTNSITSDKGNHISKGEIIGLTVKSDNGIYFKWAYEEGIISGENSNILKARPLKTTTYMVTVTNANGCTSTSSITIEVKADYLKLESENFITPNGDGINDTWVIHNIDAYPNHTITIADRNGRIVYQGRNYKNNWDGTYNGSPLAVGTYYYTIQFDEKQPNLKVTRGFITVVRNNQ